MSQDKKINSLKDITLGFIANHSSEELWIKAKSTLPRELKMDLVAKKIRSDKNFSRDESAESNYIILQGESSNKFIVKNLRSFCVELSNYEGDNVKEIKSYYNQYFIELHSEGLLIEVCNAKGEKEQANKVLQEILHTDTLEDIYNIIPDIKSDNLIKRSKL